jgi:hypothetical protein
MVDDEVRGLKGSVKHGKDEWGQSNPKPGFSFVSVYRLSHKRDQTIAPFG